MDWEGKSTKGDVIVPLMARQMTNLCFVRAMTSEHEISCNGIGLSSDRSQSRFETRMCLHILMSLEIESTCVSNHLLRSKEAEVIGRRVGKEEVNKGGKRGPVELWTPRAGMAWTYEIKQAGKVILWHKCVRISATGWWERRRLIVTLL